MPWQSLYRMASQAESAVPCDSPAGSVVRFAEFCLQKPWAFVCGLITAAVLSFWTDCPEGVHVILGCCLVLFVLDTVCGVVCALSGKAKRGKDGRYESECFAGAFRKFITYAVVIIMSATLDTGFRSGAMLTGLFATLIMVRETSSIIELTGRLGFRWPPGIVAAFSALEHQVEGAADTAVPTLVSPPPVDKGD